MLLFYNLSGPHAVGETSRSRCMGYQDLNICPTDKFVLFYHEFAEESKRFLLSGAGLGAGFTRLTRFSGLGIRVSNRFLCNGKRPGQRRARACPSPCCEREKNVRGPWASDVFRAGRTIAGDRPPRYGKGRVFGARQRQALALEKKFASTKSFLILKILKILKILLQTTKLAGDRPPRYEKKRHPVTVGRGPVPRRASIVIKNVRGLWGIGRFLLRSDDRGGQAPALRLMKVFGATQNTAPSRGTGPRATVTGGVFPLILKILKILKNLENPAHGLTFIPLPCYTFQKEVSHHGNHWKNG